ncbi:LysR family transcriptional regulator [Sphingomonas piscis]|uniref:LysR family transcriptional regulator n=1 Tax=Sphingomonas piscis TaxID=2714943 RepID=A0A6G7YMC2_9SPHN|nr:LysR substrate-binding domain-containing protein [Sphingomonas piscis]QIK77877.1 LysR family transcriptional regulator [Sphingomonas piscis]
MLRLPPLGALQAFVQVARQGSLKAAADSLALSSPALTRRIQALEHFVGSPLFERQHNAVLLNMRGRRLLEEVGPHLDALAQALEHATGPARGMQIKLAVPSLFASQCLVPVLPSLRERHPALQVELETGGNRLNRLNEGVDAAIVIATHVDSKLYSRFLERGKVVAIGAQSLKDGLRSPADLAKVPVLLHRNMATNFDAWKKSVGLPDLEPASITYFDAGQLILDTAAAGLGVAFMLDHHLDNSQDSRLVQIFDQTVESPYSYWFACLPSALTRRPVKAFHDWLFDRFAVAA